MHALYLLSVATIVILMLSRFIDIKEVLDTKLGKLKVLHYVIGYILIITIMYIFADSVNNSIVSLFYKSALVLSIITCTLISSLGGLLMTVLKKSIDKTRAWFIGYFITYVITFILYVIIVYSYVFG